MQSNLSTLQRAVEYVQDGTFRVDPDAGMVYRKFTTPLYEYVRPVGDLMVAGYVRVILPDDCRASVYVHRLMWAVYVGMPERHMQVNHMNGIKTDNRLANLELVTSAGNVQHAYDTGLMRTGAESSRAKLSDQDVREIRRLKAVGYTTRQLGATFNVSNTIISRVCNGLGRFADVA
jgi:hypothetical protein